MLQKRENCLELACFSKERDMDSFPRTEWTRRVVSGNCYRNHKAIKWEWGNQDLNVDCSYLSTELVKILSSGRTGIKDGGTTGETETSQNYI